MSGSGVTPTSSPSYVPHSMTSFESTDVLSLHNSFFNRYLGGKFISIYTIIVVLSSLTLVGLISAAFAEEYGSSASLRDEYLKSSASVTQRGVVESFTAMAYSSKSLAEQGVEYSLLFGANPAIASIFAVPDATSNAFFVFARNGDSVSESVNAANCANTKTCESDYNALGSAWFAAATANAAADFVWTGPVYSTSGDGVAVYIDLSWKTGGIGSGSVTNIRFSAESIIFKSDPFLDKDGVGMVWLVNGASGAVVASLGVPVSTWVNEDDLTPIFLKSQAVWLSGIDLSVSSEVLVPGLDGNRVSATVSPIAASPFVLVVGSSVSNFPSATVSLLIAALVVAIMPVVGTLIVGGAYTLRLVALRRRKRKHEAETNDAKRALQGVKDGKLQMMSATSGLVAR